MDKKKVLAVLALTLATSSFFPSLSSAASTGNDKVDWLIKNNQVAGRDGGNLALKDKITRAEFTKMVVDFQGLKAEADKRAGSNTVYKDVSSSHWASGVINIATEKGFVKGDTNGKFYPDDYITYNEVLTVLSRLNSKFSEGSTRGHWADQFVKFAKSHGYLKDVSLTDNDLFNNAIREKVFEIIYNSYNIVPSYKSDSLIIDGTKKTDSSSNTVAPPLYTSDHSGDYYYNGRYYNGRYYYDGKWYDSPYYYDGYYYNGRYYYDGKWYDYPYYYDGYYYNGRYYYDGKWYDYPYYHDYYKVNYYVDGSLYDTRTVKRGNYHTLLAAPSKAGYIFKNWTDSSGRVYK